jgi:spoIIIJ-associated protein
MDQLIKDTLAELLKHLGLGFTGINIDTSDPVMMRVDIESPEASRLIGWHGETINAVQNLLKAIIRSKQKLEKAPFILVDVDGYRRMQEERVRNIAREKADFARRKKTRVALPPMSPYFRRVVHLFIAGDQEMQDLTTESIGEGDYRQIVLRLKQGSIDEGEELSPVISKDDATELQSLENLDV